MLEVTRVLIRTRWVRLFVPSNTSEVALNLRFGLLLIAWTPLLSQLVRSDHSGLLRPALLPSTINLIKLVIPW